MTLLHLVKSQAILATTCSALQLCGWIPLLVKLITRTKLYKLCVVVILMIFT